MTNEFKFGKTIDNNTWENLKTVFKERNGYMSKLINKAVRHGSNLSGYLVRAEVPNNTDYIVVAFSFVPNLETFNNTKFLRAMAMNKVITGAERKLAKLLKTASLDMVQNDKLSLKFSKPTELLDDVLSSFEADDGSFTYNDFYNYVKEFENKINKYYTNKKIVTIVI